MSTFVRSHGRWLLAAALLAGVAGALGATALRPRAESKPREILLVAGDVSFHLPDRPGEANPPLRLTRGLPVRLIVRNDAPERVLHCFTIGGLGVRTSRNLEAGESEALTFTPTEAGTFSYACLLHPLMAGQVVVE